MYTKKCETCKKAITIKYKSDYLKRKDNWRFCSRDCRFFKSRSVRINCKKCDKSFKPRQIGRTKFCSKECQNDYFKNKNHHSWVGNKIQYAPLHRWIIRNYGNPDKCETCKKVGSRNKGQWNIHWSNISGLYKRDIKDFRGLCVSCHRKYDQKQKQSRARFLKNSNNKLEFKFLDI